ncbi:MAG TPA: hypothetical protein VNJ53_08380 [Gaiellaceae bacterium]|nr:hypothetical protein [Gaiellaceae bacterium]
MLKRHLRLPSPGLVVGSLALAVALGGVSYAAVESVPRGSVGTVHLKNGAVTSAKLRNQAVTAAKIRRNTITSDRIRNGTLLRADFAPGQLPSGGGEGVPGPAGPQGPPGLANLGRVDVATGTSSVSSKSAVVNCPSGKRVVGGGARVLGAGANRVSIVESFPDSDGDKWNARAAEVVGTTATWQLQAYALCANVATS